MPDIRVLFFDVGGVLLTNGWDRAARRAAVEHFGLDWEEFRDRHDFVAPHFETGELTLADYLARTVFYRERSFSPGAFYDFMKDQSAPLDDSLELIAQLATTDRISSPRSTTSPVSSTSTASIASGSATSSPYSSPPATWECASRRRRSTGSPSTSPNISPSGASSSTTGPSIWNAPPWWECTPFTFATSLSCAMTSSVTESR